MKTTPEISRLARQLYKDGMPLAGIARRTGLSIRAIYYWADRKVDGDGVVTLCPVPRRMKAKTGAHACKGGRDTRARARKGGGDAAGHRQNGQGAHIGEALSIGNELLQPDRTGQEMARPGPHPHDVGCCDPGARLSSQMDSFGNEGRTDDGCAAHVPAPSHAKQHAARRRTQTVRRGNGDLPRQRLLARLWRTAERQVAEIETRMRSGEEAAGKDQLLRTAADGEKDARALALIARTLRELTVAEDDAARMTGMKLNDGSAHDLDGFRRELARRLERLRTDGEGGTAVSGEPE